MNNDQWMRISALWHPRFGSVKFEVLKRKVRYPSLIPIHQWLTEESNRQLAIFGEYGSGKSTLCQKLARDLALMHLNDPGSSRIPILLNLRDFVGKLDLEAYITSFLDRECNVANPRIELFRAMNGAGIFLMIFDGFDEMAVKVDSDTLEANLLEIESVAVRTNLLLLCSSL